MKERKFSDDTLLFILLTTVVAAAVALALAIDGLPRVARGFVEIQLHPARLLNDFTVIGGEGAALVNAAVVALIGMATIRLTGAKFSGPTVSAVLTMYGFGLFGKTPINILPIIFGVFIAAKIVKKKFRDYLIIALFGTALGPLVSLISYELALHPVLGLPISITAGIFAGILLAPTAIVMLRLHQGFSLYNIGFTTGFVALFAAAIIFGGGDQLPGGSIWNDSPSAALFWSIPLMSLGFLIISAFIDGRSVVKDFLRIMKNPGRLPSDFISNESLAGSLANMGVMGLLSWGYVVMVSAPLNGPVLGGIFTIVGFAAFGKHPRNVWPIVLGVAGAALLFGHELSAPGVILAVLFGTTLAPLAGEFGPLVGVTAGFLHFVMVMRTGDWHAGIGLYNNGFAGGLAATMLVAIIEWFRSNAVEKNPAKQGSFRSKAEK